MNEDSTRHRPPENLDPDQPPRGPDAPFPPPEAFTPVEPDEPRPLRKTVLKLAAALLAVALAAVAAWYFLSARPDREAAEELTRLAGLISPVVRAEELPQETINKGRAGLEAFKPRSRVGEQLSQGALAFLDGDLRQADQRFNAAVLMAPDSPWPYSFLAATHLRLGNSALAAETFLRALDLKAKQNLPPLESSGDQLGLALSYFLLHRSQEALPPAAQAYQARKEALGPGAAETLSAANRLAAIEVALGQNDQAEELLKTSYLAGLRGGSLTEAGAEESLLLLTVLLSQTGRLGELEEFLGRQDAMVDPADPAPAEENETGSTQAPEPPPLDPDPETAQPAPAVEEPPSLARPSPPPWPATPDNLAAWEKTAQALAGANDALAAELWLVVLRNKALIEKKDVYHEDYRPAVLALIKAYIGSDQFDRALMDLKPLLDQITDVESAEYRDLVELTAESLEGKGALKEAEMLWQGLVDPVDKRLSAAARNKKKALSKADTALSLRLHLKLAENILRQGRVPQEAEIELRSALGRVGRNADSQPTAALMQLNLARLNWRQGQTRSSADHYKKAAALAEKLLKTEPEAETKELLSRVAREAAREAADLKAKKEAPL